MMIKFVILATLSGVSPESCYYFRCMGCSQREVYARGEPVICSPERWVSAAWLTGRPYRVPDTSSPSHVPQLCLKMVSTADDKTLGNTVDIIKGCVPKQQEWSTCLELKALQRARGRTTRCFYCEGDHCNTTARNRISVTLLLLLLLLILL